MVGDQLCAASWRARPGSFVGLMTLYESNFIRLGWLAGDLRALAGEHCSRVATDVALRLAVLERGPYTTMLQLTYAFGGGPEWPDAPDLAVRNVPTAAPLRASDDLRSRWTRNVMLNKWLEYCVERGHRFGAGA